MARYFAIWLVIITAVDRPRQLNFETLSGEVLFPFFGWRDIVNSCSRLWVLPPEHSSVIVRLRQGSVRVGVQARDNKVMRVMRIAPAIVDWQHMPHWENDLFSVSTSVELRWITMVR
jgi:hypothetical protein